MNKIFRTALIVCMLLVNGCSKFVTWDEFALKQTRYDGAELKINGYYYKLGEDGRYQSCYCFYKNGVLLNMGGYKSSISEVDEYIKQRFILRDFCYSNKPCWGIFVITGRKIQFEHYYITDQLVKASYIREGRILNDSTFHITVSYRSDGSERGDENEYYHFRKFEKPDSTNVFLGKPN
ncbi:MAG: hypothetical protein Q4G63_12350 [Bacteroidia bacterium]|nr:hypothetical protein [Bacteroidia bacterium]